MCRGSLHAKGLRGSRLDRNFETMGTSLIQRCCCCFCFWSCCYAMICFLVLAEQMHWMQVGQKST